MAATAEYGERFTAAIQHANVVGTQFHPEKSDTAGLTLLAFGTDAALSLFAESIHDFDVTLGYFVVRGLNALISWLILAAWFGITFRTLSLAKVPWRAVTRGAALTALLISLGETVLGRLLVARNLGPVYGYERGGGSGPGGGGIRSLHWAKVTVVGAGLAPALR